MVMIMPYFGLTKYYDIGYTQNRVLECQIVTNSLQVDTI
jgi:hypothetical protein